LSELIGDKRHRRRLRREAEFGPERLIVSSCDEYHHLECGHMVTKHDDERSNIKEKRCYVCKNQSGAV